MYSDAKKFPNSGGYVWLSDDSRNKYVSVFKSSIFETVIQPPSVVLKLVYHYVCQVKFNAQCSGKPLFFPVPVLTNFWPPRIFFRENATD